MNLKKILKNFFAKEVAKEVAKQMASFTTLIKPHSYLDFDMVFVEGGTFATESRNNSFYNVTLNSFNIGKYLVTQSEWMLVMGENPSHFIGKNLPVENVSWDDIQLFIQKLNEQTGKNYRLPNEDEWEFAARGGNLSNGYKYAGSDVLDDVAWHHDNSNNKTHPVGKKKSNELGIYDMSGNVWEWCNDRYDCYDNSHNSSIETLSRSIRVLRGGSWSYTDPDSFRVGYRYSGYQNYRHDFIGFRLVVDVPVLK